MYTLHNLQERLDKAKSTLREVENNICRAEGKPPNITFHARFSKGDGRAWRDDENSGERRPGSGGEQLVRRRRVDASSSRWPDGDGGTAAAAAAGRTSRRSAPSSEDGPPPRKKFFPTFHKDDVGEGKESLEKRRSIFSALGRMQNPDSQLRSRHIRQRDEDFSRTQSRSIFARLSGPQNEPVSTIDDEDEQILQRQSDHPSIASRVQAIERPTLSREQVLASEKKDEKSKQRDRRMFGALVGTLQQFRREETQVKEREERRQQIEKKLEEEAMRDRERMAEEKRSLMTERNRRESDIKRIEWSLNRVKEFAEWETGVILLKNFIRCKSKPHVFFMPKIHNERTNELLEESSKAIQELIEKRRATLEAEISSSEQKARRAAGELDEVDKENDADQGNMGAKGLIQEDAEMEWTDPTCDKAAADDQHVDAHDYDNPSDNKPVCEELTEETATTATEDVGSTIITNTAAASNGNDLSLNLKVQKSTPISANQPHSRSQSPKTSPKTDSQALRKVKSRSRSRNESKSRSRSPKPKKVAVKKERASPAPSSIKRAKSKSRSRSKSRDSAAVKTVKTLGINERLERLAGQDSVTRRRRASHGSSSRSSSSSSRSSSSTSDSH